MSTSVAVIGANGSVGSIVTQYLVEGIPGQGVFARRILAIDLSFTKELPKGVEKVIADATDIQKMKELLNGIQLCVYCAAPTKKNNDKNRDDVFIEIPRILASQPSIKRCVMLSSNLVTEKNRRAPPRILLNNGILLPGGGSGYMDALMEGENQFRQTMNSSSPPKDWMVVRPGLLKDDPAVKPNLKVSVAKGDTGTVPGGDTPQSITRTNLAAVLIHCLRSREKNVTFEVGDIVQRSGCCAPAIIEAADSEAAPLDNLLSSLEEDDLSVEGKKKLC